MGRRGGVGFFDTIKLMYSDYIHWCQELGNKQSVSSFADFFLRPGTIAVFLHRIAFLLHNKNLFFRILSRFVYLFNVFLTGADIAPTTQIGKGFVLFHSVGTAIFGKLGDNVIISAKASIGGDGGLKDVGAGGGLPVIGNNVKIGTNVTIIGGIVIADGVNFAAGASVYSDVLEPYVLLVGSPAKVARKISKEYSIFGRQDK